MKVQKTILQNPGLHLNNLKQIGPFYTIWLWLEEDSGYGTKQTNVVKVWSGLTRTLG